MMDLGILAKNLTNPLDNHPETRYNTHMKTTTDPIETDDDPYYRECMAAETGDDMTKADYMAMYDMEDDR